MSGKKGWKCIILWNESVWFFPMYSWRPAIVPEELHLTRHKIASRTKSNLFYQGDRLDNLMDTFYLWFSHFYTWNQQSYSSGLEGWVMIGGDTLSINRGVIIETLCPHNGNVLLWQLSSLFPCLCQEYWIRWFWRSIPIQIIPWVLS